MIGGLDEWAYVFKEAEDDGGKVVEFDGFAEGFLSGLALEEGKGKGKGGEKGKEEEEKERK